MAAVVWVCGLFAVLLAATVVEGKAKCIDLDARCSHWKSKGECTKSEDFMKRNCKKSCRLCEDDLLQAILDDAGRQTIYMMMFLAILIGGLLIGVVRVYFAGGSCSSLAKLHGKTVIVTGANTGIGRETALSFAGRGAKVILACRSYERGLKALKYIRDISGSKLIEFKKLDLSSFESVREFAKEFNEEENRLDILVNNAGLLAPEERMVTRDGHELTFQVNHLGAFLLTNLLLEKLKKSSPSRIVNVASSLHHKPKGIDFQNLEMETGFNRFKQLQVTKLANVLFTHELSKRIEGTGVTANSLNPGLVNSDGRRNIKILQWKLVKLLIFPLQALFMKSPRRGAQTSIYVSVAPELKITSGKYFEDCKEAEVSLYAKDDGAASKLWEVSERLTGLAK